MTRWARRQTGPSILLGTSGNRLLPKTVSLVGPAVAAHRLIRGLTGQGKSWLVASIFVQLLRQGIACCLIDPHADLARLILRMLNDAGFWRPQQGFERLYYVNFNNPDFSVPFNVLRQPYGPKTISSHMLETSKRVWPSLIESAPMFDNVLTATVMTLVENGLSLPAADRLLTDRAYRESLIVNVSNKQIVDFWHSRYDKWGREAPTMIESTLRRIFLLTFPDALRYSVGQTDNLFNFRELMDKQVSVIVNLGGLDAETQKLIGSLVTVGFEIAALSREDIPEAERQPYQLILDEASMYLAKSEESLARVLSLARKYNLVLSAVIQTNAQLGDRLESAFQNAIHVSFKLGPQDAITAARTVYSRFDPAQVKHADGDPYDPDVPRSAFMNASEQQLAMANALMDLKRQEVIVKVDGAITKLRTLTVPEPRTTWAEVRALEGRYAALLGRPRAEVVAAVDGGDGAAQHGDAPSRPGSDGSPSADTSAPSRRTAPRPRIETVADPDA